MTGARRITAEVRAHNLADALSLAAVMPITAWFEDELNNGGAS